MAMDGSGCVEGQHTFPNTYIAVSSCVTFTSLKPEMYMESMSA